MTPDERITERQAQIRERMERAADLARGLGTTLSLEDVQFYSRAMDEAALPTRQEMEDYYAEEARQMREMFPEEASPDAP